MATSDRKREANRRNSERSTGPKSGIGKAHSSSNSTTHGRYAKSFVPQGQDKYPFHELEREIRDDVQPQGAVQEKYFKRLVRTEWYVQQTERAILRFTETTPQNSPPNAVEANGRDADLIALKPEVDAAVQRSLVAATKSEARVPGAAGATKRRGRTEEIDRAVLEGLAQPGQGGQLSQLFEQLRKLERDFDRNLKLLLALQHDSANADREHPNGESE